MTTPSWSHNLADQTTNRAAPRRWRWQQLSAALVAGDPAVAQRTLWRLIVLAGLALIGGLLNLPFSHRLHFLKEWIHPVIVGEHELPEAAVLWVLAIVAITGAVVGIVAG